MLLDRVNGTVANKRTPEPVAKVNPPDQPAQCSNYNVGALHHRSVVDRCTARSELSFPNPVAYSEF
jgi:hypothetical protein